MVGLLRKSDVSQKSDGWESEMSQRGKKGYMANGIVYFEGSSLVTLDLAGIEQGKSYRNSGWVVVPFCVKIGQNQPIRKMAAKDNF